MKLAVGEALQCPTIVNNGFGGHRIEGIGDKHIPWIHNVKNTDMAIAIDDEDSQRLLRLFSGLRGVVRTVHLVQLRDPALVHGGGVRQHRAHHVVLAQLVAQACT